MLRKFWKARNCSVQQIGHRELTCWRKPVACKANSKHSDTSLSSSELHARATRIQNSGPGLDLEGSMDLSPQAAPPSSRLKAMSSSLIEQMQHEAGQRLALQQQLLRAQQEVLDAYLKEEASSEERDALRARAERLSTTISMMENRFSKLQADLEVNEERLPEHLPPSPTSPFSKLIHNSSICRSICAGLRLSLEEAWNWAVGTASTVNRQGTNAEGKEEGTDNNQALQSNHQALSDSRDALMTERDALAEQLSAQQQALEQAASAKAMSTASLQREVESTGAELSTTLQKLEHASEQQAKLNADVHSLRAEASATSQERDALQQELSRLRAELEKSQEGQAQLQSTLDGSRARHAEQEAAAQLQLATSQAALDYSFELLRNTMQEKESLGLRSSEASEQVRTLSLELQSLLDGRRQAESEIGSLRQQLIDLQAQQEQAQQQRMQQQEGAAAAESRRDVQRLQMMLNTSERERELEIRVLSSNYRNLASQNAALTTSVEQLVGKLQKAELELLESQAMHASEAGAESPAVRAAQQAAAGASDRAAAAEVSLQAQTEIANAATSRASAADKALQEQTAATAAESARAAAAEDALQKQVAAATAALERSVAAEEALREMRKAATLRAELMDKELQEARHRLAITESFLAKRMAVVASLPRRARGGRKNRRAGMAGPGSATATSMQEATDEEGLPGVGHSNTNRYFLLPEALFDFVKALAKREASLQSVPGYLGITLQQLGPQDFQVKTLWDSPQAFEAWALDRRAQQQAGEMPPGVLQYLPKKGEGVPDGYTPLKSEA